LTDPDDEPTTETLAPTDAQLLAEYWAKRRLEEDACRAIGTITYEPKGDDE